MFDWRTFWRVLVLALFVGFLLWICGFIGGVGPQ